MIEYLRREGVRHGQVGEGPAWHVLPHVSIWAIESAATPGAVGWWVFSGDGPTDYVSALQPAHPRDALRALAVRWKEIADHMRRGEAHPTIELGGPTQWPELGPLLERRAEVLEAWVADDSLWPAGPDLT